MVKEGILYDKTYENKGEVFKKDIHFISRNYKLYPALKQDPALLEQIKEIEAEINNRIYYYIPKEKIGEITPQIQDGDIILITTGQEGLDTAHLGFAVREKHTLKLLHASSTGKKVMITSGSLEDYIRQIPSFTGIMIGRIVN